MIPLHPQTPDAPEPPADEIESALVAYQAGAADAFDRLIERQEGGSSNVCEVLHTFAGMFETGNATGVDIPGYEIVGELGRGGMGVVLEARQQRTGRLVAVKLLPHWATAAQRHDRLFRRELHTLSRLNHPNIATLYDAEKSPAGLGFLVMERIEGDTLDAYAARLNLADSNDRRKLLKLFVGVCRGIAFAHQKGVVHCDLKMKNVMVTPDGAAKVLDFGLARLLDPDHGASVSLSMESGIVGTLAYLSPEQTRGTIDEIDTRSDVYSLGVILYELIVGKLPYEVRGRPLPEVVRTICERQPARPRTVRSGIPADLETIVLKALAKPPDRRYRTADALADDIERYLGGLPIEARRASVAYQLSRFARRHKLLTVFAVLLTVVLIASSIIFAVQSRRIAAERDNAIRVSNYVAKIFETLDPTEVGSDVPVRDLLDRAAASLDAEMRGNPDVCARLHETLGDAYFALSATEDAEREYQTALKIRKSLYGVNDVQVAQSLDRLSRCNLGDRKKKLAMATRALAIRRENLGDDDPAVADSYETLMTFYKDDFDELIRLSKLAIVIRRAHAADRPRELGATLSEFGGLLVEAGEYDAAEPVLNEALGILRDTLGENHFDVVSIQTDLGEIALRRGDYDAAERAFREQIRGFRKIFPRGHKRLAFAMNDLASILALRGQPGEAASLYNEAFTVAKQSTGVVDTLIRNDFGVFLVTQGRPKEAESYARSVYTDWTRDDPRIRNPARGYAAQNLGRVRLELNQLDEAERLFKQAEEVWRNLHDGRHPKLAVALTGLGEVAERRGQIDKALAFFDEAHSLRLDRQGEEHHETALAAMRLAVTEQMASLDGAIQRGRDAVATLERRFGRDNPMTSWAIVRLANMLTRDGDAPAGESLFREAIAIEREIDRPPHPNLADALIGLARILAGRGDNADALPLAQEALEIRKAAFVENDPRIANAEAVVERCTPPQM